jgi:uncharacterized damage-inducible protein DinB
MHNLLRHRLATVAALLLLAPPLAAQSREGVMGELINDISQVEKKVTALAEAMPESAYAWRPADGVRSVGEVLLHIAADNYFMPAMMGKQTPKEIGITGDYDTAAAWEKKPATRAAALAELQKSFAFLRDAMSAATDADLAKTFGQRKTTARSVWISTATHLHEHLGQLIAYARSNKVTPPWSK